MRFEAISEDTPMLPRKPKTKGRAIIAYFWNPDFPESYRPMDRMDLLQTQNRRDLVVVGVLSPLSQNGMHGSLGDLARGVRGAAEALPG